ncbi:unnamed protein product, partial [Ixodes pacificus]
GCDTGFGHELAKRLDAGGFQVLAGCLNPSSEGATMLRDFCSPSLRVVHLDVTKEDHIRRAAKTLAGELGTRALWAVVANAGMMSAGELEWGSSDSVRYLFEVNVFGVVNVVKMALPFLRRTQNARVVIVASVAGENSYYRFRGVRQRTEAMSATNSRGTQEKTSKWGERVSSISTYCFLTKMALPEQIQCSMDQAWQDSPESVRETYGKNYFEAFRSRCLEFLARRCRDELYEVVDNMVHAVSSRRPKRSYFCGGTGDRFRFSLLRMLAPTTVDRILCSINQSDIRRSISDE